MVRIPAFVGPPDVLSRICIRTVFPESERHELVGTLGTGYGSSLGSSGDRLPRAGPIAPVPSPGGMGRHGDRLWSGDIRAPGTGSFSGKSRLLGTSRGSAGHLGR